MTSVPPPPPPPPPPPGTELSVCALCRSPLATAGARCEVCGLHAQLGSSARNPFDGRAIGVFVGVFLAVYAIVLAIVAAS